MDFQIAESLQDQAVTVPWARSLVALGDLTYRFCFETTKLSEHDQLVLVLGVPTRSYAAVLIAVGWMMKAFRPPKGVAEPDLSTISSGSYVRLVAQDCILTGKLQRPKNDRVCVKGSQYLSDRILAVTRIENNAPETRSNIPSIPTFGPFDEPSEDPKKMWAKYLSRPPEGLTIVGTKSRLKEELNSRISRAGSGDSSPCRISDILLTDTDFPEPICATHVLSPQDLQQSDDPYQSRTAILDGTSAVDVINAFTCPTIIAIVDRSLINENAAENLLERRNNGATRVNIEHEIGWTVLPGISAFAYRTQR